MDDGLVMPP